MQGAGEVRRGRRLLRGLVFLVALMALAWAVGLWVWTR